MEKIGAGGQDQRGYSRIYTNSPKEAKKTSKKHNKEIIESTLEKNNKLTVEEETFITTQKKHLK